MGKRVRVVSEYMFYARLLSTFADRFPERINEAPGFSRRVTNVAASLKIFDRDKPIEVVSLAAVRLFYTFDLEDLGYDIESLTKVLIWRG